jgi:AcrR family transcriptional regulator
MESERSTLKRRDAGRPRGDVVRDRVLACTLAELAENGVEGVRVDRVAKAAEVNKTSVYRRWPTREALVAAALERVADDLSAQLPDTGALRTDLEAVVFGVAALLTTPLGGALALAAASQRANPEIAELARRQAERGAAGAAGAIHTRAVARGEWRADAPPAVVFSALVGAVLHRVLLEGAAPDEAWTRALVDLLVRGVRP